MSDPGTTEMAIDPPAARRRRPPLAVVGGTLLILAMSLGFLINTPSLIGPDEPFHFDRVIAAAHGALAPDAGELHRSAGGRYAEAAFALTQMKRNSPSWAEFPATARGERPSVNDLGGNVRPSQDITNYLTQHPPLYYDIMGAVMWLLPSADDMPGDQLVLILRAFNVLIVLVLPFLFWAAARELFGRGAIAATAAFLPALMFGIPRIAATINNDNLCVVIGAALVWQSFRVLRGDTSRRTAAVIAALAVAGSLTKLTVMIVVLLVAAAYVVRAIRDRRLPPWPTIVVLAVGAVLSCFWWVRNVIKFGHLVPEQQAWGPRWSTTVAAPRPANKPPDIGYFWEQMSIQVPRRLFGSLGLHEPPMLPMPVSWTLVGLTLVTIVVAVLASRRVRLELTLAWAIAVLMIALMVNESLSRYTIYTALTGIQGRYIYPAALGLLLPFAVALVAALGRGRRWAPLVMTALVAVLGFWTLDLSFAYAWLHRFEVLTPGNLGRGLSTLAAHFPYGPAVLTVLIVLAVAAWIGAVVVAWRLATQLREDDPAVATSHPTDLEGGRVPDAVDGDSAGEPGSGRHRFGALGDSGPQRQAEPQHQS